MLYWKKYYKPVRKYRFLNFEGNFEHFFSFSYFKHHIKNTLQSEIRMNTSYYLFVCGMCVRGRVTWELHSKDRLKYNWFVAGTLGMD